MTMGRFTIGLTCAAALAMLSGGCGSGATIQEPADFVVLEDDQGGYEQRATSAHGVVLAVRDLDNEVEGNLRFWVDAIKNRLRTRGGYALLEESEVRSASGHTGHQMRYGRDESGASYHYWVTVFVTADRIVLVEAGGKRDIFEEAQPEVEQAVATVRLE